MLSSIIDAAVASIARQSQLGIINDQTLVQINQIHHGGG